MVTKIVRCGDVYEECALSKILFEGLGQSIRQSMRELWAHKKEETLTHFLFYATSLLRYKTET